MGISSTGLRRILVRARPLSGVLACALAGAAVAASPAAAAGPPARSTWLGAAPTSGTVSLALPLKADLDGLRRFATAVSTPGSAQYGQFESIAALARRFGAPAAERSRVVGYLKRTGATGVKVDVTGLFADATLRVAQAERLFGTTLGDFHTAGARANAATFMAPANGTRLPAQLRRDVTGVVGLDTRPLFGSS